MMSFWQEISVQMLLGRPSGGPVQASCACDWLASDGAARWPAARSFGEA